MKYLRVHIEGPVVGSDVTAYERLDDLTVYMPNTLKEMAADIVSNYYSYSHSVVDEAEVPERER